MRQPGLPVRNFYRRVKKREKEKKKKGKKREEGHGIENVIADSPTIHDGTLFNFST